MSKIEPYITSIPGFPEPDVIFRDITTVVGNAEALKLSVDEMSALIEGDAFDAVVGLESRGFLFGAPLAYKLNKAFIPLRKEGKLPRAITREYYELEYGAAALEVHTEDVKPGMRVVLVDDLIATGGTLEAAARLMEQMGAVVVRMVCLIELKGLNGRARLAQYPLSTVVAYEGK